MLWWLLALAADPEAPAGGSAPIAAEPVAAEPIAAEPVVAEVPEPLGDHRLTLAVRSPPAGAAVQATALGQTLTLRDPGTGVHTATFAGKSTRFTQVQLTLVQNGVRLPLHDGLVALSDGENDVVAFVVTGGSRPSALRTTYAPSALVRLWADPVSITRYGWAAVLALYAAVLLIAATRRA